MKKPDTSVLQTVTGTFKNVSFYRKDEAHAGEHLALMNIPHWLAKRDAAYEGAVFLIKNTLVSRPPNKRKSSYARILTLLNLASKMHKRVMTNIKETKKNQIDYIGKYFTLLANLVLAGSSLLDVDVVMTSEKHNSLKSFVGNNGAVSFEAIRITCMEDEKKLHESTMSLISSIEQVLGKAESRSIKALAKIDKDRYDEAFAELKEIYRREEVSLEIRD